MPTPPVRHNRGKPPTTFMTLLALDIGNTRLKWAHYASPLPGAELLAHGAEFLENIDKLGDDVWATLPQPTHILGCVVAGDAVKRRVDSAIDFLSEVCAFGGFQRGRAENFPRGPVARCLFAPLR